MRYQVKYDLIVEVSIKGKKRDASDEAAKKAWEKIVYLKLPRDVFIVNLPTAVEDIDED